MSRLFATLSTNQHALDFSQFGITRWQRAGITSKDQGPFQNIDVPHIDPYRLIIGVDRALDNGLLWRFAPPQHDGAMSPQLLYRTTSDSLLNSVLTIVPSGLTSPFGDVDIAARMFTPHARDKSMLHVYQGWLTARIPSVRQFDFYMAAIYRNNADAADVVSIWKVTGGIRTLKIAAAALGDRINWTKPWNCRFNLSGNFLRAKWWTYDDIEPEAWDLLGTDSGLNASGMIGFAATVHGQIAENVWGLDWYAWSNDPEIPAPLYPND